MNKLLQILNALITTEQKIIPIVVHNPNSQNVAGIILASEEVAAEFVTSLVVSNTSSSTSSTAATTTGATSSS